MAHLARLVLTILILALAAPTGASPASPDPALTLVAPTEAPSAADPPSAALPRPPTLPAPQARHRPVPSPPRAGLRSLRPRRNPPARAPPRP